MVQIEGEVAFVTGANRGIGLEFARELARRGAKVYAGVRDPRSITEPGLVPIRLDVTDVVSVEAAAKEVGDVAILVNNAGYLVGGDLLTVPFDEVRKHLEINYLGTWAVSRAFAPTIVKNRGAIVNMLSVASWFVGEPIYSAYAASKSAQWSITNAFRNALKPKGVRVLGVHVGYVDTDMVAGIDVEKITPAEVARAAIQGLLDGAEEVLVDQTAKAAKKSLSTDSPVYFPET